MNVNDILEAAETVRDIADRVHLEAKIMAGAREEEERADARMDLEFAMNDLRDAHRTLRGLVFPEVKATA